MSKHFQDDSRNKDAKGDAKGVSIPVDIDPITVAVNCLKQLVHTQAHAETARTLDSEDVWTLLTTNENYPEGFMIMAR